MQASAGWSARTRDSRWATIDLAGNPHRIADVARQRTPCIANGLDGEGDVDQDWVQHEKIASLAYFPLLVGDELVGVLAYFSRLPISEDFADALSAFVAIATSAINNVRLFAREQAARLEAERDRQWLRTVLDTIPVGVLVAEGPEGRITLINPAGVQIGGRTVPEYSLEEFQAEIPLRYLDGRPIPPDERPLWRAVHRGERIRETLLYRRPDGQDIILDVTCAPFPGAGGGAISTYRDVTEQRRLQSELQAAMVAAELASRNKTRFLSAVSHDLRTPVNAMSLLAELLGHLVAAKNDPHGELAGLARDIRQSANSLIELLNDLLELSRFDSDALEIHRSSFILDDWLAATLKPLEITARAQGLHFESTVDLPGRVVWGDRVKMGRVLTNLVGNAIKFTARGQVQVSAAQSADGGLVVAVTDSGPGIPQDQISRIFDEFAQLQNPERDRTKGIGLGLAICRRLVEAVGGSLRAQSAPGAGSTFSAWYPPDHLPGKKKT